MRQNTGSSPAPAVCREVCGDRALGGKKMIRNIVFDIGGVLADFRMKEFLMEKGLDAPMIRRVLKASVMNPYWGKFERGEATEEETLRAFAAADPEIEK